MAPADRGAPATALHPPRAARRRGGGRGDGGRGAAGGAAEEDDDAPARVAPERIVADGGSEARAAAALQAEHWEKRSPSPPSSAPSCSRRTRSSATCASASRPTSAPCVRLRKNVRGFAAAGAGHSHTETFFSPNFLLSPPHRFGPVRRAHGSRCECVKPGQRQPKSTVARALRARRRWPSPPAAPTSPPALFREITRGGTPPRRPAEGRAAARSRVQPAGCPRASGPGHSSFGAGCRRRRRRPAGGGGAPTALGSGRPAGGTRDAEAGRSRPAPTAWASLEAVKAPPSSATGYPSRDAPNGERSRIVACESAPALNWRSRDSREGSRGTPARGTRRTAASASPRRRQGQ